MTKLCEDNWHNTKLPKFKQCSEHWQTLKEYATAAEQAQFASLQAQINQLIADYENTKINISNQTNIIAELTNLINQFKTTSLSALTEQFVLDSCQPIINKWQQIKNLNRDEHKTIEVEYNNLISKN